MAVKMKNMISMYDPRVAQIGHPAPPWLVNYADLMTELCCFFIILYALSAALSKNVQNAKEKLEEMMKQDSQVSESVSTQVTKEGIAITLEEQDDRPYFEIGKAEITDAGKAMLDRLIPVLSGTTSDIIIEGHTDDTPIHTVHFDSNWELSTARSTNVVKYLVFQKGLPPQKLSAIGFGEYKPIVPNDTPENRAKNRRVVIFMKK